MKEMWNARYGEKTYAYGKEPNVFFRMSIEKYGHGGKILLPAEGEGRNAVYAAKKGYEVTALDISEEGKKKALILAQEKNVKLKYQIGDLGAIKLEKNRYDMAALIYAHFPAPLLREYHQKIADSVKPKGILILEGFAKSNLPIREKNPKVGGPNNIEMLFSIEEIKQDFIDFEIIELDEMETHLNEGEFHQGLARVVRFIGRKKHS